MGWIWFIPTFHMPQPPPSAETPTTPVHWLLSRKDVDFPIGFGAWIVDIDVEMSWVPSEKESASDKAKAAEVNLKSTDSNGGLDRAPTPSGGPTEVPMEN